MSTNTNTSTGAEAKAEEAKLTSAVSAFLTSEAKGWDVKVKACEALAAADAASALDDGAKAKVAAKVRVAHVKVGGHATVLTMSKSTYSKRVKVGRFASETAPAFVMDGDMRRPITEALGEDWAGVEMTWRDVYDLTVTSTSLETFYNFLPKAEHLRTAKGEGRRAAARADETETETGPATFADDDAAKVARDFIAGLRTRGATDVQVNLVIAEMDRLMTPVRSVRAA